MIPLLLVTGFLGAGKTTLINRLLKHPALADALVVVNEFGEIGLDHELYEPLAEGVLLLASGCLCCELRGDLVEGLKSLLVRREKGEIAFERIVLETSGLADPAPILHALYADRTLAERLRLSKVVTLVDAVNGEATLERYGEARRQIAMADSLVLTKTDLTTADGLARLRTALASIRPTAHLFEAHGDLDIGALLAEAPPSGPRATSALSVHSGAPQSHVFRSEKPVDARALRLFLAYLGACLGPRLLRVKGLIALQDDPGRPLLVQGAQHAFAPPARLPAWPTPEKGTRLVVIGDGLSEAEVAPLWRALEGSTRNDEADLAALADNPLAPKLGGLLS